MNYRIGICDTDSHYSVGLMEYINTRAELPLRCSVFSSMDSISEHTARGALDLILLDENMSGGFDADIPIVRTTVHRKRGDGERAIYKYQSAEGIAEELLSILNNGGGAVTDRQRLYAVYSPLGRCGKTRLAMAICGCYRNSLYIGLEDYCAYADGMGESDMEALCADSGSFLYHLIGKNEGVLDCVKGGEGGDGFTKIRAAYYFADGRQLDAEHISWFRDLLDKNGGYSRVVFDINTGAMSDISLLEAFDAVFVPALCDGGSRSKLLMFYSLAKKGVYSLPEDKLKEVYVPDGAYDSAALADYVRNSGM